MHKKGQSGAGKTERREKKNRAPRGKTERRGKKTVRREKKNRAAREKTERGGEKQSGADHVPSEPPYYSGHFRWPYLERRQTIY